MSGQLVCQARFAQFADAVERAPTVAKLVEAAWCLVNEYQGFRSRRNAEIALRNVRQLCEERRYDTVRLVMAQEPGEEHD